MYLLWMTFSILACRRFWMLFNLKARFNPVLRFASLEELTDHFAAQGVTSQALEAARRMINTTGVTTLTFYESGQ